MIEYRLLAEFRNLFFGKQYIHRASNLGDFVAMHLYEDLATLNRSNRYTLGVTARERVLNVQNKRKGIKARRGDGSFGELIPGETPIIDPGYLVARGPVATIEIGAEVKILAKAMIKQIDRVTGDLKKQVSEFKYRSGDYEPICVGIVGITFAPVTTGYEGDRSYRTDGAKHKHPYQEAPEAQRRLMAHAAPAYDEFLVLRYKATNEPPYPFEWVDYTDTVQEYGAILTRISRAYERRFATEYSTARKDSGPAVEAKPRVVVSHSPSGLTVTNYGPRLFGVNFKSRPAEDMVVKFEPVPALAESASVPLTFSIVSTDGKTNFACGLEVVALAAPHSMVPVIITCQDGQRRWWEGVGALVFDQTARQWNSAGFDEMRELPMS